MRGRTAVLIVLGAVAVVLLVGCSSAPRPPGRDHAKAGSSPEPAVGGPAPSVRHPPAHAMDSLEKPVAARLARQIAPLGLRLDYLDCPHWDGAVPSRMTCRGYVDGVVARVLVVLRADALGRAVWFDARLGGGVIATRTLEDTLRHRGWTDPDRGRVPAYPARVGTRIVCRVGRSGAHRYLVVTVRSRAGAVMIGDVGTGGTQ